MAETAHLLFQLTRPAPFAATLELVTEKSNAHSDYIRSVAFSPDGKTIVSGSRDQTLKVWDSGAFWVSNRILWSKLTFPASCTATLELKSEKANAHSGRIYSVAFSPDGKTIVSGSNDRTLKVWGALAFLNCQP